MSILQTAGTLYTDTSLNLQKLNKTLFDGQKVSRKISSPSHKQQGKRVLIYLYEEKGFANPTVIYTFPVNPEEFQVTRQDRTQVYQTLGDPFIDDLGIGLPTLSIRGTTGWRTRPGLSGEDGYASFKKLNEEVFKGYHNKRALKAAASKDPDDIQIVVFNEIDDLAYRVVPISFELLRNRTQPLLYQYNMQLRVIQDLNNLIESFEAQSSMDELSINANWDSALLSRIDGKLGETIEWINDEIIGPAKDIYKNTLEPVVDDIEGFMTGVGTVLNTVDEGIGVVASVINSVTTSCGNLFTKIMNTGEYIADIPIDIYIALNHVNSTFHEMKCYVEKGLKEQWFADYRSLQGVTDCALTLNVTDGVKAMTTENAIAWATELNEIAKNKEGENIVTWKETYETDFDTPMAINHEFSEKVAEALAFSVDDKADVKTALEMVKGILECVSFNSDAEAPATQQYDEVNKISQVKEVTVEESDTLHSIAYKQLGDADRWKDIVAFNDIVIESPDDVFYPTIEFVYSSSDIAPGNNYIDYGSTPPEELTVVGNTLRFISTDFKSQELTIRKVEGTKIYFNETFSKLLLAPVKVICYRSKSSIDGHINAQTTLSEAWTSGKTMKVADAGNIYAGYILYLQGVDGGYFYTVESVDHFNDEVTVDKISLDFDSGQIVEIFNTESPIVHIQSGTTLKIPMVGTEQSDRIQTDEEIFGTDLKLNQKGFVEVVNGDLDIVSGKENLKQSIQHRLYCPYKSIIIHPEYGCGVRDTLGQKLTEKIPTLIKAQIISALTNEPRAKSIGGFQMTTVGDAIGFSVKVQSTDENTTTDMNFVLAEG